MTSIIPAFIWALTRWPKSSRTLGRQWYFGFLLLVLFHVICILWYFSARTRSHSCRTDNCFQSKCPLQAALSAPRNRHIPFADWPGPLWPHRPQLYCLSRHVLAVANFSTVGITICIFTTAQLWLVDKLGLGNTRLSTPTSTPVNQT